MPPSQTLQFHLETMFREVCAKADDLLWVHSNGKQVPITLTSSVSSKSLGPLVQRLIMISSARRKDTLVGKSFMKTQTNTSYPQRSYHHPSSFPLWVSSVVDLELTTSCSQATVANCFLGVGMHVFPTARQPAILQYLTKVDGVIAVLSVSHPSLFTFLSVHLLSCS